MKIRYTSAALDDLRAALEYLHARNAQAASDLADRIEKVISMLADGWLDGPEQTLRTGERVHSWAIPPLRVYYQRSMDTLVVLRLYDQRQRPITRDPSSSSRRRRK